MAHVIANVSCQANTKAWTEGKKIELNARHGMRLKQIQLWFPSGTASVVYIRITKGGAPLVPDNRFADLTPIQPYGDGITCEGGRLVFDMDTELKGAEYLSIDYRNKDTNDVFEIFADFDIRYLPTDDSSLRT